MSWPIRSSASTPTRFASSTTTTTTTSRGPGHTEEPVYLGVRDVLEIHAAVLGISAPQATERLRSDAALSGALARPINYASYQQADLALQAAVLAHGIAETQTFIDGNKRTALIAMLTFLHLNGHAVNATDTELADWIIGFSTNSTPTTVADAVRARLRPVP